MARTKQKSDDTSIANLVPALHEMASTPGRTEEDARILTAAADALTHQGSEIDRLDGALDQAARDFDDLGKTNRARLCRSAKSRRDTD